MSNEFKDKACNWLTKKKYGLGAVIVAGIYVVLIASLLIGATTARYKETRTLYSNFDAATFNAVILGQERAGLSYNQALSALKGKNLYAFAETFNSLNFHPGETRDLPFSIANGILPTNVSEVNMVYSIKLRTNGNIPLTYRLKWKTTEQSGGATIPVTKEFAPSEPKKVNITSVEGDSLWNEYSFYEVTKNEENKDVISATEASFPLPANELDLNLYELSINWPINDSGTTKPTNDTSYMKEVEVMEVFVTVTGLNETTERTEVEMWPAVDGIEYFTTGVVFLLDGNDYKLEQQQKKDYPIDFRAFYSDNSTTKTYFKLNIEDGIKSVIAPSADLKAKTPKYTRYTMELLVPIGVEGEGASEYSSAGYQYNLETPKGALEKLSSRYIIMNVHDETEKELSSVTTDEGAIEYWRNSENPDQEYVYRVDKFCLPGSGIEYSVTNENQKRNSTTGDVDEIVGYKDPVTIVLSDKNGDRVNPDSIPGTFSVDHKLYLRVSYMYSKINPTPQPTPTPEVEPTEPPEESPEIPPQENPTT